MAAPIANPTDLDEVIEHARSEVRVLLQQRVEIRKRLTVLRRTIIDLGRIFGHDPTSLRPLTLLRPPRRNRRTGLTDTCRSVLMRASQPLTAREIVEQVQASHSNLIYHHKDPVASVTSILIRLESYGEAASDLSPSRRRLWMFKEATSRSNDESSTATVEAAV